MLATTHTPPTVTCREFACAFRNATIGMALLCPRGQFVQVNRALCDMLGYTEHQLLGSAPYAITLKEDQEVDRGPLARLLAGEIPHYEVEKRLVHLSGHVIHAQFSVSLIQNPEGIPEYFIAQIQDISAYRETLKALRATNARLTTLIEQLPIGVVLEDERRQLIMANDSFCQIMGLPFSPAEMKQRDCRHLAEDSAYLFARPEFMQSRIEEIVQNRRPVHNETLEMADGRTLRRDYIPVFVDGGYQGNLWTFSEDSPDVPGGGP